MRAKELRIGNYVGVPYPDKPKRKEYIKIDHFHISDFYNGYFNFNPVLLTHDILYKCGFKVIEKTDKYILNDKYIVWGNMFCKVTSEDMQLDILNFNMEYLHQLQNLFFSLENEELKVNI